MLTLCKSVVRLLDIRQMKYFGGIEGGACHSKLVICDQEGKFVTSTTGLGTNHWIVGIQECARRIYDMVKRAKEEAGITECLTSLGLCLSGYKQEATNKEVEREIRQSHPDVADNFVVCGDAEASIFTASPIGGLVVISGTGSTAFLRNPDGSTFSCGGWGHFLGDEGTACWISHRAVKIVVDDMDNFIKSPYPIEHVWELIRQHFSIETRVDLLDHCYAKFDKPFFARLCKKLAEIANDGDKLCISLFHEAGRFLARHMYSILPQVQQALVSSEHLNVVCAGSVWLSWPLLKDGFLEELDSRDLPFGLKLITITKNSAYGAVYLAADGVGFDLPRNYEENYKVFYHYQKNQNKN